MRSRGLISIFASEIEAAKLPIKIFVSPLVLQQAICIFIGEKMGNPGLTKCKQWSPKFLIAKLHNKRSCEICGEHSDDGSGFLRVLRFPLSIFIPPIGPQSPSYIIWGWYSRPVVAEVPSGLSLTSLKIIIKQMYFKHSKRKARFCFIQEWA
jgi:hypothetical protein